MSDLNFFVLSGRLGADPEMSFTPSGLAVTKARIAVTEWRKNGEEFKETTHWFPLRAFSRTAEKLAELNKGDAVSVTGRLVARQYEQDGQKKTAYEYIVDAFSGPKKPKQVESQVTDTATQEEEEAAPWD